MQTLEQRVQRRLDAQDREIGNLHEGLAAAHEGLLDEARQGIAQRRLIMAMAAVSAKSAGDPLLWLDEVRTLAFRTIGSDVMAETREILETTLTHVEAFLIDAAGKGDIQSPSSGD